MSLSLSHDPQGTAAFNSNPSGYQVFRNVKVCSYQVLYLSTLQEPFF